MIQKVTDAEIQRQKDISAKIKEISVHNVKYCNFLLAKGPRYGRINQLPG